MTRKPCLLEDMHVHSTFSDGKGSVAENVAQAERLGLHRLTCVDHVRADSTYLPALVKEVARLREASSVQIYSGVEAKFLDGKGLLDLPADLTGIDYIYAADHQFPLSTRCHRPLEIRHKLVSGELGPEGVVRALIEATLGAIQRYPRLVLAHLFSILPKLGIAEDSVPLALIEALADAAQACGAAVEIDERWRCPGARTLRPFLKAGVPILLSTDSHSSSTIGCYVFAQDVLRQVLT